MSDTTPAKKPRVREWRGYLPRRGLPDSQLPRPQVLLEDCGPSKEGSAIVAQLNDETWRDPHDFTILNAAGEVIEQCTAHTWAIEDEIGASVYAIVGDALSNLSVTLSYSSRSDVTRTRREERIVVEGLRQVGEIAVGRPHRALRDLEVSIEDYDSLSGSRSVLHAGAIFRPWQPLDHWRFKQVPITLGNTHARFDWGVDSAKGHFLRWDDFFSYCEPCGLSGPGRS